MDQVNESNYQPRPGSLVRKASRSLERRGYYIPESPYGFEASDDPQEEASILDYWRIVVRNKWPIFITSVAGLVLAVAICIPMQPVFRAQTSLEVLSLNQDFLNMRQSSPTNVNDGSYETSEETTKAKLLQSGSLARRIFAKLDPADTAKHANSKAQLAKTGWRRIFHLPEPMPVSSLEAQLSKAANSVKVHETPHTRVLEISVDSANPQLAADYANTMTQEFIAQSAEDRWQATQSTSEWLKRELEDARNRLRRSEDDLQAYARDSGLIFTDESTNVTTEKLQQVQQQLSTASADRIAKQSRFELAQNSPPESLADVLNDASLRETQSKINDLNRQIADLSAIFNPEYSKIKRLQAERESLQAAFAEERSEILSRIQTDYQEASRKEKLLASAYEVQTREVTGQGEKTIQYNILKREADSNRQLYDTMLQQMKQSSIASAMRASNVHIVDSAQVPTIPVFPNFRISGALGALAGLFLSTIVVIVRDQLDRTLHQPGDIKRWVDLLELGAIPNAAIEGHKGIYENPEAQEVKKTALPKLASATAFDQEPAELITWQKKPSLLAESFRSALTSILFVGENGNRPHTLIFTSVSPADGKTTVVSNLAIAAAEIRFKVLIIDADLRRPRMHKLFNLGNEHGLSDFLQGSPDADIPIQNTTVENLHVLTAGAPIHAAAHLLHSPNLAAALQKLRFEYDLILIDTPPMGQMSDARIIARQADASILVARAGKTSRDALSTAKQRFEQDRIPLLGSVLNGWDLGRHHSGYYYSYRNGKNYGYYPPTSRN